MRPQDASKHLQGVTDLTLLADIEPGFIDALDSVTYETRLRLVMKTLHALRLSSREHATIRPFSDAVERIQMIHSFRVGVAETERGNKFLLAVTFDGGWEPYIRRIWRDLGPLLDVMLCNCKGYKSAAQHGFDEYVAWIREQQVDSGFFYNASSTTVTDLQYLRQAEKLHREGRSAIGEDMAAAQMVADDPEKAAVAAAKGDLKEARRLGILALSALYRLTDYYPPERADGAYLLNAAHALLKEVSTVPELYPADVRERKVFPWLFDWFEKPILPRKPRPDRLDYSKSKQDVQGGILSSYDRPGKLITHGALLLIQAGGDAGGRAFLRELQPLVSTEEGKEPGDGIYLNIALTAAGLEKLGVPEADRNRFPKEFREGMEVRCGLLGDFRANHPRNWKPPKRNWPPGSPPASEIGRVQLSAVDYVVQLRTSAPSLLDRHDAAGDTLHPLHARIVALAARAEAHGARVLGVESMLSIRNQDGRPIGHLGFLDDASQPKVAEERAPPKADDAQKPLWSDEVPRGEILWGYAGSRDDPPPENAYLDNGSFLVVRKLALDLGAVDTFTDAHKALIAPDELLAKMMGRRRDGEALADPKNLQNDFNYEKDALGALCPFQAHVRRANPREIKDGVAPPRIMRRGMSYGPLRRQNEPQGVERGLMFMAYGASIAEQFEVIQRWLAGGNSSGVFSGEGDPFLAVPQKGDRRTFRFQHDKQVARIDLDDPKADEPMPFARLDWGVYLFAPSVPALERIAAGGQPGESDEAAEGDKVIKKLLALETVDRQAAAAGWKAAIEDLGSKERGVNVQVWAAIRKKYGGALWTPYGVLVASREMVEFVFNDPKRLYSVEGHAAAGAQAEGYKHRTAQTIGEIYLGLDKGPAYEAASQATNRAISMIDEESAFTLARDATKIVLEGMLDLAQGLTGKREAAIDLKALSDRVLGFLSAAWFDLPDEAGRHVLPGGWDGSSGTRKARCPGDFTSPSRYIFSPNPGKAVRDYAVDHGQRLRNAVLAFIKEMRPRTAELNGPLSKAMFEAISDDGQLASTLVGVMMGFLPTADGCFRSILHVWLTDRSLWRVQASLAFAAGLPYERADKALRGPLMQTLQKRPVPDIVWRTASVKHDLGPVAVQPGDRIVVGIVSATREMLDAGETNVYPVFGGQRTADGPTHACPGYYAAMGVLLGMISALLDAGTLLPHPMPLTVTLTRLR